MCLKNLLHIKKFENTLMVGEMQDDPSVVKLNAEKLVRKVSKFIKYIFIKRLGDYLLFHSNSVFKTRASVNISKYYTPK